MQMHNSTTHRPRQVHGRVPVLHIRGTPRRNDHSSQNTTSRSSGNVNNLPLAPNRVESPRVVRTNPSPNDKSSPNKRLNPRAVEYVPATYTAPAATDPGWVDFRNPSPSLSRGSTLNPIEEEPDLIFDDVTDGSFVEDRLPDRDERDEMTGGFTDNTRCVYNVEALLSLRSHWACQSEPEVLDESVLTPEPFHSAIKAIVQAMNNPIVLPPRQRKRTPLYVPQIAPNPYGYFRPKRWKPPKKLSQKRPKTDVPRTELEKLMRKTRGILNRIGPDKFDRLSTRLFELIADKVTCAEHLETVLEAVVNTAVMQPAFVERYVQLLGAVSSKQEIVDSWEWVHAEHLNSRKIIRGIVLNVCRRLHELYWFQSQPDQQRDFLFEFGWSFWDLEIEDDVLGIISSFSAITDEEAAAKLKSQFFGIEIVMAEMCNQQMMSKGSICHNVINPLLRWKHDEACDDDTWRDRNCSAVELEALCKLLTAC